MIQIAQTVEMVRNPFQLLRRIPRNYSKMPLSRLRQASKRVAGGYLEYKFGWENIYRSVMAIANVWKEVRQHKEYLRNTAHQYTPLSQASVATANCPDTFISLGDSFSGTLLPSVQKVEQVARFSLNIMRETSALELNRLDLVIDRLGLRDFGEALWDAVPYSFVVDWFTHVNRVFQQAPISWNRQLRRIGYSLKTKWYGQLTVRSQGWTSFGGWGPTETKLVGPAVVQEKYERYTGFPPNTSSVGLFGNLNKTQIAEGIALLVQRI